MHEKIAKRLSDLRGKAPQAEIAKVAGVSPASISNWEAGLHFPPADAIAKLAVHWKVSADYLVGISDFPSGLAPDSFLVDLDVYENLTPGKEWAAKVPRRPRVVDFDTWKKMGEDVAARSRQRKRPDEEGK